MVVSTLLVMAYAAPAAWAAEFTVTNTNDSGAGSLRQAILDANTNDSGPDTISFAIPDDEVKTISPGAELPIISAPVVIDGETQDPSTGAGTPDVELNGQNAGTFSSGLVLNSSGITVRGLVINRFNSVGIYIAPGGSESRVQGNYIGTDATGQADLGNSYSGVLVRSSGNIIGGTTAGAGNVISGNSYDGVDIDGSASGNKVEGNYIGTDATGQADLGNSRYGLWVKGPDNTVGGTVSGARNVISGNDDQAVYLYGSAASGNEVEGNYIGIDATGQEDVGNSRSGVYVEAPDNRVGGTASGARNVISGNGHDGVALAARGNEVAGNYIGTDATGQNDLGNSRMGVVLWSSASNSIIGGMAEGASNVISGNDSYGLFLSSSDSKAEGNYIGTDVTGRVDLGNSDHGVAVLGSDNTVGGTVSGARNVISGNGKPLDPDNPHDGAHGVLIYGSGASNNHVQGNYVGTDVTGQEDVGNSGIGVAVLDGSGNTIGGTAAGAPNVMAFNGRDGAAVVSPGGTNAGNAFLSNSIFSNGHLGIDLGVANGYDDGLTPNDPGDADAGPNGLQNFPELGSAIASNGTTTVEGTLDSTPSSTFTVQFFSSPQKDPSGHGEGKKYLGQQSVTTDPSGKADLSFATQDAPAGASVSATATAPNSGTSEFSGAVTVSQAVTYAFTGFFSPVDNPDVATNRAKAGSSIPVKFSLGGDQGLDIFESGYPLSRQIPNPQEPLDAVEQTVTAGASGLSYDPATDRYTYVWKTEKGWVGQYRQLVVKLDDGTTKVANFNFTK
jgi:titin